MRAVWFRARLDLRRQLGGLVAAIVVVAIAGGLVLAAIAGASRTRSALPHFVEYVRPEQLDVFLEGTLAEQDAIVRQVRDLADVATVAPIAFVLLAGVDDRGRPNFESRLILLKRRLDERSAPIRIEKTGRGRFRPVVDSELVLESVGGRDDT